jgi:transketolase
VLSIDAVEKADSGHPGLPLGAAPMAYVLWTRHLKFDCGDPGWPDRDRFVLSAGHGSALLYSLLHLAGYDLPMVELEHFRQWGSRTPGHPEFRHTPGVEATTGPLGQGFANAVGMAMAERFLAQRFNRPRHTIVGHTTYVLCGDGDLMEGISYEAASLAGHLRLGKLVVLYDANDVTLDGPLAMHFGEDVTARFEALGWHVQTVHDGETDLEDIDAAISAARAETARPSLVIVRTVIGFGAPHKAGTSAAHGAPLGAQELAATKAALGWDLAPFEVPDEAREHFAAAARCGAQARKAWVAERAAFAEAEPELAAELDEALDGELPARWDAGLPTFEAGSSVATRTAGGKALAAIARNVPWLFGGDADLSGSTKTLLAGEANFDGQTGAGRNVRYGVREHAMGAIANGIAYHGGARTWTATFFVFADYMRPAIRLAAMNRLPVVLVFTHDSIGVGEDGPTHQPVEHLASLRAIPGLQVLRPCDATETVEAWRVALETRDKPTVLVLSRQNLPTLDRATHADAAGLRRGAYVLRDPSQGQKPRAILIATGSEVALALAAQDELAKAGVPVRVVSMPSWDRFAAQDSGYRDAVLPPALAARVSVEAGVSFGWERWIGTGGAAVAIDRFGASAPAERIFAELGFTVEHVVRAVRSVIASSPVR